MLMMLIYLGPCIVTYSEFSFHQLFVEILTRIEIDKVLVFTCRVNSFEMFTFLCCEERQVDAFESFVLKDLDVGEMVSSLRAE